MTQAVFTSSGSWSTPAGVTSVDLLIVGGGGAGGSQATSGTGACGGGGAGQVSWVTGVAVFPGDSVPVVVGAGGVSPTGVWGQGGDGTASSFTTRFGATTAAGGGGGGALATPVATNIIGRTGASGGGGGGGGSTQNGTGGTATAGNAGGAGIGNTSTVSSRGGGGGGGAGGAGAAGVTGGSPSSQRIGGAGGVGVDHSAHVGTSVGVAGWFGGGGAGGTGSDQATNVGPGGQGGGGNGALGTVSPTAAAGTANTGGGGGGGGHAIGRAGGNGGSGVVIVVYTAPVAPGAPTSLAAVPGSTAIAFSWAAPVTGDPATGYKVRIDGGTWTDVGLVLTHTFTGLTPSTAHTLEVEAYNAAGDGTPASLGASTAADMPDTAYQADIRVGSHTWTCSYGDTVDPDVPNVLAGAAFTWAAPDNAGWPPPLHTVDRDVLTLRLYSPDAADFGDIRKGDVVRFKFTPAGYTFTDPLVDFAGRVRAVKVEDRQTTGAFLQLTAADHTVTLQDWTVPGETFISEDGDTRQEVLERISDVLDSLNAAYTWDWVPGGFGSVLSSIDPSHLGPLGYLGTVAIDYTIGPDQQVTAVELFATYGTNMFPVPLYDDTTGELDPVTPFVIAYLDTIGRDETPSTVDACTVPTESVDWQRDYTPNIVEWVDGGTGGTLWAGEGVGAPQPVYDDWRLIRVTSLVDINSPGITAEQAEPGPWGPYTFTVLGWQGPGTVPETGVAGWLRIPDRFRQYVTLTGIDPTKNPNGDATVSGMLRGCTWSIRDNGRWTIDAGIRRSHGYGGTAPFSWNTVAPTWTWDDLDPTWTWDDM